jgi:hypothetical protein
VLKSAEIIGIDNINNNSTWTNACKTRLRVPAALNDNLFDQLGSSLSKVESFS